MNFDKLILYVLSLLLLVNSFKLKAENKNTPVENQYISKTEEGRLIFAKKDPIEFAWLGYGQVGDANSHSLMYIKSNGVMSLLEDDKHLDEVLLSGIFEESDGYFIHKRSGFDYQLLSSGEYGLQFAGIRSIYEQNVSLLIE